MRSYDQDEPKTVPISEDAYDSELSLAEEPEGYGDTDGFPYFTELMTGERTPVKTAIFVCGFSPRCDLKIKQPPERHTVSRFHATVTTDSRGRIFITDESLNGTFFIDDKTGQTIKLPKGSAVELKDGQLLRFATADYRFSMGEKTPK